jgi:co-chaperonin GroES (HSP10)
MPAAAVYNISEADDPKSEMLKTVGDLSGFDLAGARVLVWPYIRSRKTKSGIILTDKSVKEDVYQGAVGYVLKIGPLAFQDDEKQNIKFAGFACKEGDWVAFSPGEGKRLQINGVDCRLFEDSLLLAKVADPDTITHRQ